MTAATEDLLTATGNLPAGTAYTGLAGTGLAYTGQAYTGQAYTGQAYTGQAYTGQPPGGLAGPVLAGPVPVGTVQTHRIFIRATSLEIWDALTRPGWTQQYGYRAPAQYDLRPGGAYRAFASVTMKMRGIDGVIFDGEVLEAEPPRRLVQTWRVLFDPRTRAEADTRLTWEIEEGNGGVSTLTLTHDLAGAPHTAALAAGRPAAVPPGTPGGGWAWILSDLKTLLETGQPLAA
jgi:uncharacterized protein YndB with AHSA1/START domain